VAANLSLSVPRNVAEGPMAAGPTNRGERTPYGVWPSPIRPLLSNGEIIMRSLLTAATLILGLAIPALWRRTRRGMLGANRRSPRALVQACKPRRRMARACGSAPTWAIREFLLAGARQVPQRSEYSGHE